MSPTFSQLSALFLHAPRTRGLYNQHWTGRGSGGAYTRDVNARSYFFVSQTPESKNILDQCLQSANGTGTQLSVACRMRVARVPSYASMYVMYIHMEAPALTYGNVPLCHVLSCCPYVLIRSWPHNCDDVIHFVNQFFRAYLEMGSWFKPICHRDFPSALCGLEDASE